MLAGGLPGRRAGRRRSRPASITTRVGVKRTVLVGLALLAATTIVFGFAHSDWLLVDARASCRASRSSFTWAAA